MARMVSLAGVAFSLCLPLFVLVGCGEANQSSPSAGGDHGPSSGAEGKAGAKGTFSFKPTDWKDGKTTWWKDSDGVLPGEAGCHIGTDEKGEPNGRTFGEACTPEGLLVESNPGAGVLHKHTGGIGHPDLFDCNAWCVGSGSASGKCVVAEAPPCSSSAKCSCE